MGITMDIEELKLRRLYNQFLIEKGDMLEVVSALNGFQAQFMSNALHSMKLRCRDAGMTDFEECVMFDQWGGGIRELCERGFMNFTVEERKAYRLCNYFEPMDTDAAELEIARRYFTNFAPASVKDAAYYIGISQTRVKALLDRLPVCSCECGGTQFFIDNGRKFELSNLSMPECLFLAGFDQLLLGYEKKESVFLAPEFLRGIFNLAGIVMPAVLFRGNVVGRWRKKGRKLEVWLFSPLCAADREKLSDAAGELWGDVSKIVWE